jgi:hypothetical protein
MPLARKSVSANTGCEVLEDGVISECCVDGEQPEIKIPAVMAHIINCFIESLLK